jgi:hypothetical protein
MKYINLKIPEHSYFFGFIQADGTLRKFSRNRGYLEIELKESDREILKSFKKLFPLLCSSIKTRIRDTNFKKHHKSCSLRIFHKEFRDELIKLGLSPGKKFLNTFPPKCSFSERDYIRGLIDGDGSVGITKKGFPFITLTVKSEALKNYLCGVIEKVIKEKKRISRNKRDDIYNIMLNREKAQKFIKYLYYSRLFNIKKKTKKGSRGFEVEKTQNFKKNF